MSCGIPLPPAVAIGAPTAPLLAIPDRPDPPDLSWADDLDLALAPFAVALKPPPVDVPSVPLGAIPIRPTAPDLSWADDLDLKLAALAAALKPPPIEAAAPPLLAVPLKPALNPAPCPFDDEV